MAFPANPPQGALHVQDDREYIFSNGIWFHNREPICVKETQYKVTGSAGGTLNMNVNLPKSIFASAPIVINYTVEWGNAPNDGLDFGGQFADVFVQGYNNGVPRGSSWNVVFLIGDTGQVWGNNMANGYSQVIPPLNTRIDEFRIRFIYNYSQQQPGAWINFFFTAAIHYGQI